MRNITSRLKCLIEDKFPDFSFELNPYGSSMTDLMTPFSDLDLSIVTNEPLT